MYLNSGDEEESSKSVYKSAKKKKKKRKGVQSPSTFLFSYQTQMQEKLHLITNAVLHQCLATCFLHSCICRGRSRATALHRATRLRCDIFFSPPLFKATFRTQAHLSNTATLLQKTKYFKGGSCLRMLFFVFFFFFQSAATGEGKKDVNHSIVSEVYSIFITCELVVIAQKPFSLRRT